MAPTISVIIPARDAAGTLTATLAALGAQSDAPPFEVVVVDDGSRDATATVAAEHGARVVRTAGDGPARARNAGVRASLGELLAFTDADCVPEPGWLAGGLDAIAAGAELVQGRVGPPGDHRAGPFDRILWVTGERGLYETANLFVTRALFDRLGGFESWLAPRRGIELGEDVWLGWRARRAGAPTGFAHGAGVQHAVHRRRACAFVAEQARRRFFCALVHRIPELREVLLWRRLFFEARSAGFDLALVGCGAALACRRPAFALLTVPYAALVGRQAAGWGRDLAPRVALAGVAADAVGAAALLFGSVRYRSVVL